MVLLVYRDEFRDWHMFLRLKERLFSQRKPQSKLQRAQEIISQGFVDKVKQASKKFTGSF